MNEIKFLLDVNVGSRVRSFLGSKDFDVLAVVDVNPRMRDKEILALAHSLGRVIITADKDFGELVFKEGLPQRGVILLEDTNPVKQQAYLDDIILNHPNEIQDHFIVAQNDRIRIRKFVTTTREK